MKAHKWQVLGGVAAGALMLGGLVFAISAEPAVPETPSTSYGYSECMDDLGPDAGDAQTVEQLNALVAAAQSVCEDYR
ncbi:hypothetical protein ABID81_002973 [Frigoribacterium sp. PvP054]|uniref:hypothetical protein n=1 Tax=Frigoribacterium sp. PvP054 TaxID=3156438 RepID=UPI003395636C